MLGKGKAEAIDDSAIERLAIEFGCHPAALEAISEVESNGFGWFPDGRIKILFEKHWMYKLTSGQKQKEAVNSGVARRKWISPKNGGYKEQKSASDRYRILSRAMEIDETAALQSISMGKYQIMGFNYMVCGFASPQDMWAAFLESEKHQLRAFATFLEKKGLVSAIRRLDFDEVEEVYNGGGLKGAYARRMDEEYERLKAGKWKGWNPDKVKEPPVSGSDPASAPPKPDIKPITKPAPSGFFHNLFKRLGWK